jgi:hypothetical protein
LKPVAPALEQTRVRRIAEWRRPEETPMPRYYFDLRDGEDLAVDEEGMELRDIATVQEEAARSLADMARDAVRSPAYMRGQIHRMAIEVRDKTGPVLQVKFTFEVARPN